MIVWVSVVLRSTDCNDIDSVYVATGIKKTGRKDPLKTSLMQISICFNAELQISLLVSGSLLVSKQESEIKGYKTVH